MDAIFHVPTIATIFITSKVHLILHAVAVYGNGFAVMGTEIIPLFQIVTKRTQIVIVVHI